MTQPFPCRTLRNQLLAQAKAVAQRDEGDTGGASMVRHSASRINACPHVAPHRRRLSTPAPPAPVPPPPPPPRVCLENFKWKTGKSRALALGAAPAPVAMMAQTTAVDRTTLTTDCPFFAQVRRYRHKRYEGSGDPAGRLLTLKATRAEAARLTKEHAQPE